MLIWWITIFSKLDKINKYFGLMIKIAYPVIWENSNDIIYFVLTSRTNI